MFSYANSIFVLHDPSAAMHADFRMDRVSMDDWGPPRQGFEGHGGGRGSCRGELPHWAPSALAGATLTHTHTKH